MRVWMLALFCVPVWMPGLAQAIEPALQYNGRAYTAAGEPVAGPIDLVFRLYDQSADGTLLFQESFVGADAVPTFDGFFSVVVFDNEAGTMALDDIVAVNDSLFVELVINGDPLLPRQRVTPVPSALVAGVAGGGTGGAGGGGGTDTLAALLCADGQVPTREAGAWACGDVSGGTTTWADIQDKPVGLVDLGQTPSAACTPGQVLSWSGSDWACITPSTSDARIGALTAGRWCTSDGTSLTCTENPPLLTELDPKIGTVLEGNLCTGNGAGGVDCALPNPIGSAAPDAWCTTDAFGIIQCNATNPDTRCDTADCGVINVAAVQYTAPRTHRLTLGESEFRPRDSTVQTRFGQNFGGIYITSPGDGALVAPVRLPDGARIMRVTMAYRDVDPALSIWFLFMRQGYTSLALDTLTSGTPGNGTIDLPLHSNYVVTGNEALSLWAYSTNGTGLVDWPNSNLMVYSATIEYELDGAP